MFVNRLAAVCATMTLLAASHVSAQSTEEPDCWRAEEMSAARIGNMQTLLMVQSLKCQDTTPETVASYNKFMAAKHDVILKDRRLIQSHFVRQLGPVEGMKASEVYDTKLGNQSSSPIVNVAICEKTAAYSRLASVAGEEDLMVLAGMMPAAVPATACAIPNESARPAAMVIHVWNRAGPAPVVAAPVVAPTFIAPPVAVTPAVVASVAAEPVAIIPAVAPASVQAAPVAAPAAAVIAPVALQPVSMPATTTASAPSNADAVKALQAAVAALAQVAASLQPVRTAVAPIASNTEE